MTHLGKPAAIVLATLLVALTPLFVYADAVPKSQVSIEEKDLLDAVDDMMGGTSYEDSSHGNIVSYANKNYQELVDELGLEGKKFSRGQLISILARSKAGLAGKSEDSQDAAKKPNDKHSATTNSSSDDDEDSNGKGKGKEKSRENKPGNDNATASSRLSTPVATTTPVPTATTAVPTATTAVPTATTAVPTATTAVPTTVTATATVTPTPEVTPIATATEKPGNNGQGHGNGNQGQ